LDKKTPEIISNLAVKFDSLLKKRKAIVHATFKDIISLS
jgi:hypothetical protein